MAGHEGRIIGMSHADRPYLTRPLAGVDQALGDGRARQPVELLDQLRERLNRLDPNHPSASQRSPDWDVAADPAADQVAVPQESACLDRSSLRKEGAGQSRGDQPGDQGAGELPAAGPAERPAAAAVDDVADSLASDAAYRVVETGRAAKGEPYRPWFAGDEPGAPWFVD